MQGISRDIKSLVTELQGFRGGVTDTSTLIYLERLGLLRIAARRFPLLIIPQVAAEYGALPEGTLPLTAAPSGVADAVLCQMARRLGQPVLSEDKQVLRAAREGNLPFYNTLMIVLALCIHGELTLAAFPAIRRHLLTFARYSPRIVAVGDAVFHALRQSRQEAG